MDHIVKATIEDTVFLLTPIPYLERVKIHEAFLQNKTDAIKAIESIERCYSNAIQAVIHKNQEMRLIFNGDKLSSESIVEMIKILPKETLEKLLFTITTLMYANTVTDQVMDIHGKPVAGVRLEVIPTNSESNNRPTSQYLN